MFAVAIGIGVGADSAVGSAAAVVIGVGVDADSAVGSAAAVAIGVGVDADCAVGSAAAVAMGIGVSLVKLYCLLAGASTAVIKLGQDCLFINIPKSPWY